ncbi:MAG: hypothetical protein EHM91_17775 [Planctomycetota bacterium]|nr:MAG: hypothetical protein EHM91_17775 [Planctomycetota bacterium]
MRDLERLKAAPAEDTGRICVLTDPAEESYRCETVVRVMPAWGKAWEIKRSLSDIALGFERMNPGLRRVLEQLDGLFREFLWKNEP